MTDLWFTYPNIDPVIFSLGSVSVRWYGVMYLIGFAAAYWLGMRAANKNLVPWDKEQVGDLLFYCFVGVILGGRFGYVLFYQFPQFASNPLYLFQIWEGGMSFHGGLLGVIAAMFWFGRKTGQSFWTVADFIAPMVPIGLGTGRLGNFINGELWGRVTDVPWAFVFPGAGPYPRHPSQLYEFFLEGVVLFLILAFMQTRVTRQGQIAGMFLLGYGLFRSIVEFVREPDQHLQEMAEVITMGQLLSLPMILFGLYLIFRRSSAAAYRTTIEKHV